MSKSKIEFICQKCGKKILVQADIYEKKYKSQTKCLSCRQLRQKSE